MQSVKTPAKPDLIWSPGPDQNASVIAAKERKDRKGPRCRANRKVAVTLRRDELELGHMNGQPTMIVFQAMQGQFI